MADAVATFLRQPPPSSSLPFSRASSRNPKSLFSIPAKPLRPHSSRPPPISLQSQQRRLSPDFVSDDHFAHSNPSHDGIALRKQLDGYQGRITAEQCEQVLEILAKEEQEENKVVGVATSCLYFYEWMSSQDPPVITPRAPTTLFPLLGKAGLGDELMTLFQKLPRNEEFRDVHVYNAAMSGFLYCGRYDDARKVYDKMLETDIQPSHATCSIMMAVMKKQGRFEKEALDFFRTTFRKGVEWNPGSLIDLIRSLCAAGLKEQAAMILPEMVKAGVPPDAMLYNMLMKSYLDSKQHQQAENLFAEMKSLGIEPTTATYHVLMDAYSRAMQPEKVEELLKEMQDRDLKPNSKSFSSLIRAYGSRRKCEMAKDAFMRMKRLGIEPHPHTYNALIRAYSASGQYEQTYAVFEDMQFEGVIPSLDTYTALLDAIRHAGDADKLTKIWKQMRKENHAVSRGMLSIILDGFAKQGCYLEAREVVDEFGKLGFERGVSTYNALMDAYARGGRQSEFPRVLEEMLGVGLKPDSVTYQTMIDGYAGVGDYKKASLYLDQMVASGQLPGRVVASRAKREDRSKST
ncbi:Pentatricopeptide repeat-containing protein At5g50280, chloroplastic [Linum grandiflorum]